MTTAQTLTHPTANPHTCPCGCAPDEETCCGLDCLVQPRFFCGQLLTDQDLGRLVGWTGDKLRLARYRHGWGVVCGLEVRCDPARHDGVIVGPGYAISCCGDDIVVCEDTPYDLSGACPPEEDPCSELRPRRQAGQAQVQEQGLAGAYKDGPFHPDLADPALILVDLAVSYRTELASPVTALAGGACGSTAECDYAQRRETFSLTRSAVPAGSDPVQAAATSWLEGYERCSEVIDRFRGTFTSLRGKGEQIRRWLLGWLEAHPLRQFCFVERRLCTLDAEALGREAVLAQALFWMVQDYRNAYLACACPGCGEGSGVPLARVWLRPAEAGSAETGSCSVVAIDGYPPYRRPLGPQCWPVPLGRVNGGQVIWHRWPEACTTLANLGVRTNDPVPFTVPDSLRELQEALRCSPFLACEGEPVTPQVLEVASEGRRVVGFCGTARPPRRAARSGG